MPQFLPGPVRVRVPATTANLGPGYDFLALALARYDEVEARITESGARVEIDGEGADELDAGEGHLVLRTMRRTFTGLTAQVDGPEQPPGVAVRCTNRIPHGRGLGSSAAAIVAGILLARELVPDGRRLLPRDGVFALATALEGHADNVAACVAGGLATGWIDEDARLLRFDVHPSVTPVVCVPPNRLSTELARGLLPDEVPFVDAAVNAARAALLIPALTQSPDLLFDATCDRLHQPYRAPAMPDSAELLSRLRDVGIPAVISGAGPTVLAFGVRSQVDSVAAETGMPWTIHALDVDSDGACVLPTGS